MSSVGWKTLQRKWASSPVPPSFRLLVLGGIAQLARASALQAEGQGFEALCLHWFFLIVSEGRRKNNMVK